MTDRTIIAPSILSADFARLGDVYAGAKRYHEAADAYGRAIAMAKAQLPDLIILDIMMPEMDGMMTLWNLRALPSTVQTPVIFLTAKAQEEDEQQGFDVGDTSWDKSPMGKALREAVPPILLSAALARAPSTQPRKPLAEIVRSERFS